MKTTQIGRAITAIYLILGTICNLAGSAPTEQENLSQNIQGSVVKFGTTFIKYIHDDLKPEQNAMISPLNIYTALSLLHLGTSGETRTLLSTALGIPADATGSAAAHTQLGKMLNDMQTSDAAEVKIANSAFLQKGFPLKQSYLNATKNYYKNEAQQVDFSTGSEATKTVNKWVSDNTKNRIPQLFKKDISQDTQLLLASVLFFNATWQKQFQHWNTKNEKFNTGVKEIDAQMMTNTQYLPYLKNNNLQIEAISIPYNKQEFGMTIVLPYQNSSLKAFIDVLNPELLQNASKEFSNQFVTYKLPRFKFSWSQSINNHIMKSGMSKMFANAELDNMVENASNFRVSDINHATEIQVDEDGTTASAATSIGIIPQSLQRYRPEPIQFYVDRPFLFSIYHQKTGTPLFMGVVQNPSAN